MYVICGRVVSGSTVDGRGNAAPDGSAFVVRRWWNDCFVNNKLHWRERAVVGQSSTRPYTASPPPRMCLQELGEQGLKFQPDTNP